MATANIYIDPAYTSQEAIDALGGTSSITGETLIFGSAPEDFANGANAIAPSVADNGYVKKRLIVGGQTIYAEEGYTMYVSNYNINDSFYGNGTYGLYFKGASVSSLYGLPKTAGTYELENGINITLEDSLIRNFGQKMVLYAAFSNEFFRIHFCIIVNFLKKTLAPATISTTFRSLPDKALQLLPK